MLNKKTKTITITIIIILITLFVIIIYQTNRSKDDKRDWFKEEEITVSVIMFLNENNYDYSDIRYIKTEKIRISTSYVLYQTTGQLRETTFWYDFSVDIKVYADKVETINFKIES